MPNNTETDENSKHETAESDRARSVNGSLDERTKPDTRIEDEHFHLADQPVGKLSILSILEESRSPEKQAPLDLSKKQSQNGDRSALKWPGELSLTVTSKDVRTRELSEEEKGYARYFQSTKLLPNLAHITKEPNGFEHESDEERIQAWQEAVRAREIAIRQEMQHDDPWGPETQASMKNYLELMNLRTKNVVKGFESFGKSLPSGTALTVDKSSDEAFNRHEYVSGVLDGILQIHQRDLSRPPTHSEFLRMEKHNNWLRVSENQLNEYSLQEQDQLVSELMFDRKFPVDWQFKEGSDKSEWRHSSRALVGLTLNIGGLIETLQSLNLPLELPPGTKVSQREGRKNISLDLPKTLDLNDPINVAKIERLEQWQEKTSKILKPVLQQIASERKNPLIEISFNDKYIPAAKSADGDYTSAVAILDSDGKLKSSGDPLSLTTEKGQTKEEINLLEQRPRIETDNEGNVKISMQVQAQRIPWFSPQNLIYENVGRPSELPLGTFKPDELVLIHDRDELQLLPAKELENYFASKDIANKAEKALFLGLDLAMFATGSIELAAAIRGLRLLGQGSSTLSPLFLTSRLSKGALDLSLGASGPLGNAYWNSFESGLAANQARGMIFLGTAALGPAQAISQAGKSAVGSFRHALGLPERAPSLQSLLDGQKQAVEFHKLISQSGKFVEKSSDLSSKVMLYGQAPTGLVLSSEIATQIKHIRNPQNHDFNLHLKDTASILPEARQSGDTDSDASRQASSRLRNFSEWFSQTGRDKQLEQEKQSARAIFEKAANYLDCVHDPGRSDLEEIANTLSFTKNEVFMLELENGAKLTQKEQQSLLDATQRNDLPQGVQILAEQLLATRNQHAILASRLALLEIFSHSSNIREASSEKEIQGLPSSAFGVEPKHKVEFKFDKKLIVSQLMNDLEKSKGETRSLAITAALIGAGSLSPHQMAPILGHVMSNQRLSEEEKLRSLGVLMDSLPLMDKSPQARRALQAVLVRNSGEFTPAVRPIAASLHSILGGDPRNTDQLKTTSKELIHTNSSSLSNATEKVTMGVLQSLNTSKSPHELANALGSFLLLAPTDDLNGRIKGLKVASSSRGTSLSLESRFSQMNLQQLNQVLDKLCSEPLGRLTKANRQLSGFLAEQAMSALLKADSTNNGASESSLIALNNKTHELIQGLMPIDTSNSEPAKSVTEAYLSVAKQTFYKSGQSFPALRISLLQSASDISKSGPLPDFFLSAARDKVAEVRSAALDAIITSGRKSFPEIASLFHDETDPAILGVLDSLMRANNSHIPNEHPFGKTSDHIRSHISKRYPELEKFDLNSQKAWLNQFYPLILRENFIQQLVNIHKSDRSTSELLSHVQSQGDRLSAERELQFARLKAQAMSDATSPLTAAAKLVLSSIAVDTDNNFVLPSGPVKIGQRKEPAFNELDMLSPGAGKRTRPVEYRYRDSGWSAQSVQALNEALKDGRSGKDLSELLLQIIAKESSKRS